MDGVDGGMGMDGGNFAYGDLDGGYLDEARRRA